MQPPPSSGTDPKRPYGGLVPSQPKGTRAYQDAATYNQHLAQHQVHTAQAHAASQAATTFRNPYISTQNSHQQYTTPQESNNQGYVPSQQHLPHYPASQPNPSQRGLSHQNSAGQLGVSNSLSHYSGHPTGAVTHLNPNVPSNSYYPNSRARANTINQMDTVPPALARLQHMNQDVIAGRNALTPVLNRDDAMREWERRQSGKSTTAQPYPQLEYLQQQAEMVAASGLTSWGPPPNSSRYPPSKLAHSYHPQTIVVNDESRRDAVMSNVRSAARGDGPNALFGTTSMISSPPQTYNSNATTSGNRYANTFSQQQQQQASTSPFDSIERRTDIGNLYVPMQPDQYQSYPNSSASSASHGAGPSRHIPPPGQSVAPSFYGAAIVSAGQSAATVQQPRNPFSMSDTAQQPISSTKDVKRSSGVDAWPR